MKVVRERPVQAGVVGFLAWRQSTWVRRASRCDLVLINIAARP
ncbi:hypothetical protein [Saccharothrix algeriensis]|uniref:Uncharacterized protein n=1 Tax=Saccharothrix algeriensis TaxID=173560 RepID=A0ABS2S6S8_9PSEU|nr:hypothetical protein [Saccharothrix algeriensis]MBM7810998.1 hypothetical protein [Saccharothrix algeriensis]